MRHGGRHKGGILGHRLILKTEKVGKLKRAVQLNETFQKRQGKVSLAFHDRCGPGLRSTRYNRQPPSRISATWALGFSQANINRTAGSCRKLRMALLDQYRATRSTSLNAICLTPLH
jgi:hypothetical protein